MEDNDIEKWSTDLGECITGICSSENDKLICASTAAGDLAIIDAISLKVSVIRQAHKQGIICLDHSSANPLLATGGQDGQIKIWNTAHRTLLATLNGGNQWVENIKWSHDGKYIASTAGKYLKIWSSEGVLVSEYKDIDSSITGLCWKKDSSEIVFSGYGGIKFIKPEAINPHQIFAWKNSMISLTWSPDEKFIGAGTQDAKVHFWELPYIQDSDFEMDGYPGKIRSISWDSKAEYMALCSLEQIVVWKFAGKSPIGATPIILAGHSQKVTKILFQNHSNILASADVEGKIFFWYPGKLNQYFGEAHAQSEITHLLWSRNDTELIVGTKEGKLMVFELV